MGAGYHGGFGNTKGATNVNNDNKKYETDESLKSELRSNNIKFNEADMVFIARDKTGQIVWLENGNSSAGLTHILDGKDGSPGHAKDFERAFGVQRQNVGSYLKEVIKNGSVVSNRLVNKRKLLYNDRNWYEWLYCFSISN